MADDASAPPAWNASYFIVSYALHQALPPAIPRSSEAMGLRIDSAVAMVASLVPVNLAEAMLATNWVVATMQAIDSQAAAHEPGVTPEWKMKCLAQASSMQRNAKGLLEQLRQMQVLRMKREGLEPSPDQAAWIEHRVGETMQATLGTLRGLLARVAPDPNTGTQADPGHATSLRATEAPGGGLDQNPGQNPMYHVHETDLSATDCREEQQFHMTHATGAIIIPGLDPGIAPDSVSERSTRDFHAPTVLRSSARGSGMTKHGGRTPHLELPREEEPDRNPGRAPDETAWGSAAGQSDDSYQNKRHSPMTHGHETNVRDTDTPASPSDRHGAGTGLAPLPRVLAPSPIGSHANRPEPARSDDRFAASAVLPFEARPPHRRHSDTDQAGPHPAMAMADPLG